MGYAKEREAVKKNAGQFPNSWSEKVDKMSDAQVLAIYLRLKAQNKIKG